MATCRDIRKSKENLPTHTNWNTFKANSIKLESREKIENHEEHGVQQMKEEHLDSKTKSSQPRKTSQVERTF